jgi:hypothetical protein
MNTTPATLSALLKSFVAEHEGGAAVEIILLTRAARAVRCKENHMVFANRPNIEVAWRLPLILMSQSTQSKVRVSTGLLHDCFSVFRGGTPQRLRSAAPLLQPRAVEILASPVLQRCATSSLGSKKGNMRQPEGGDGRTHLNRGAFGGASHFCFWPFCVRKRKVRKKIETQNRTEEVQQNTQTTTSHHF